MITLGQQKPLVIGQKPVILCDSPELKPHLNQPWFRAHLTRLLGSPVFEPEPTPDSDIGLPVGLEGWQLDRHAFFDAPSGMGKTYTSVHLLGEQVRQGSSAV